MPLVSLLVTPLYFCKQSTATLFAYNEASYSVSAFPTQVVQYRIRFKIISFAGNTALLINPQRIKHLS
jgi:hypothetical protein